MARSLTGYFDAAAGLPLHPVAASALAAAIEDGWADPSRPTGPGRRSAVLLDAARQAVAEVIGVRPDEISFVPSAAHALQLAISGALHGRRRAGREVVHSAIEHSMALRVIAAHVDAGGTATGVGVSSLGRVDEAEFIRAASRPGVAVAVLQAANHEVGTRQPVDEVAGALNRIGVPLVVDATHEVLYGSAPVNAPIFTLDPRLWGGPAGVGILVVRTGTRWQNPWPSDDAEFGRSPGVPNVPAVVAAAASLRAHRAGAAADTRRLYALIDLIRAEVVRSLPDCEVLGDPVDRLPHLVTFSLLYAGGEALMSELDRRGFTVSSGSSCTADTITPSHVLVAMRALTSGNVRVSLPPDTAEAAVDDFLRVLPEVVEAVRAEQPGTATAGPAKRTQADADLVVDSRGRRCPLPILDLARALSSVGIGATLTVLADDPAAAGDIAAWCRMKDHALMGATDDDQGGTAYRVRRLR